jgi:hypothetical protein
MLVIRYLSTGLVAKYKMIRIRTSAGSLPKKVSVK